MNIKTFQTDSIAGLHREWSNHTADGFSPVAAIVFASVSLPLPEVCAFFEERSVRVFGASTCGEFLYDDRVQVISDGGMVCLLLDLKPGTFGIKMFGGADITSRDLGKQAGAWAGQQFADPLILVMASGLNTDGEQLVRGIQEVLGEQTILFGGLAGDDARFVQPVVFTEQRLDPKGSIVMVFDGSHYRLEGIATSGWVSIGADKVVTGSEGNIVYTIDNEPALDVYREYLNIREEELPEIGVEYPLLLKKKGMRDVLRAVTNVDREKKALIFAGSVPAGSVVTFSSSPGFEIIETTVAEVASFHEIHRDADILILFSCMARHNALGPTISEEISDAWKRWNRPLIGFFTYGEIGSHPNESCDFHNETFTMVALKELD